MDPVPSGFTFKWFFKPTFFVQSYETINFTVFPLSWYVLVIIGSPLIPNGERWESLWQMQIWKHREWWATWILGWSLWKPNKPEKYLHLFIWPIFLGCQILKANSFYWLNLGCSSRRFGWPSNVASTFMVCPGEGRWIFRHGSIPFGLNVVGSSWSVGNPMFEAATVDR